MWLLGYAQSRKRYGIILPGGLFDGLDPLEASHTILANMRGYLIYAYSWAKFSLKNSWKMAIFTIFSSFFVQMVPFVSPQRTVKSPNS